MLWDHYKGVLTPSYKTRQSQDEDLHPYLVASFVMTQLSWIVFLKLCPWKSGYYHCFSYFSSFDRRSLLSPELVLFWLSQARLI
jgi:hypothetical protein